MQLADWLTSGGRESFVVVSSKIVTDIDVAAVVRQHREHDAAATMVLRETPDAARWGAIEADEEGRVTPHRRGATEGRVCMFTGVRAGAAADRAAAGDGGVGLDPAGVPAGAARR